ncbi:tetratricopeptide repeat protein [Dysgonomonas sp. BGC7]|uniref:tetratricopeptide repeat protein n=1 Tax=Dysgonomonas sp. BGC7 TaxID=1658008 RepID=UPI000680997E|nr:tetratricopeptide repeat protein [Dysgonomonas sp. BGC7]MBD8387680.1 tetratricopeptide repeat protein [Dysgonomonas sp. BGC7]
MAEKNISTLVKRYEEAQESGKNAYFDADEFSELADYYDGLEDLETARTIINSGLAIHPGNTPLLVKKAKLAVYDGEYDKALQLLQSSTEYDFDLYLLRIECHLQLGQYEKAYRLSEELLEKEEDESIDNIFAELGFLHVEADCFKEAILYFEESLKANAGNIDVLSDLAYAYEMVGNIDEAIATTNKILDLEPYTYEAWINLGKLYSMNEDYERAIDAFDFALTVNDADSNIIKLKAHCLSLSGRAMEAIDIFNDLLLSNPDDTSICFLLAECYQSLEMYDEALASLDLYEMLDSESEELFAKRAHLYLLKDDYDRATLAIQKGLEKSPDSLDLRMVSAEVAFKQGLYDMAKNIYLKLYEFNRDDFFLIDKLAIVSIKVENYREAASYTEKLLDMDPNNMSIKVRLALLYFEIDDKDEFNAILDQFTDKELSSLFQLIYTPQSSNYFDRDMLISYLNKARETRTLFKNLKY